MHAHARGSGDRAAADVVTVTRFGRCARPSWVAIMIHSAPMQHGAHAVRGGIIEFILRLLPRLLQVPPIRFKSCLFPGSAASLISGACGNGPITELVDQRRFGGHGVRARAGYVHLMV